MTDERRPAIEPRHAPDRDGDWASRIERAKEARENGKVLREGKPPAFQPRHVLK
jgi:hypothetical protein